jgi:nucleoside phosphorylase
VLLLETGIGTARTAAALQWLLNQPSFGTQSVHSQYVLSAGFSGALEPSLHVGHVVLATEVLEQQGNRWSVTWPADISEISLPRGRLLTVAHLVGNPEDKRQLGHEYDALAVDMETATVARLCSQYGVPFGCVRAISDEVHTALSPRLVSLLSGGRVSALRVLAAIFASPRLVGELWVLARHTRRASQQLAKALASILLLLRYGGERPA